MGKSGKIHEGVDMGVDLALLLPAYQPVHCFLPLVSRVVFLVIGFVLVSYKQKKAPWDLRLLLPFFWYLVFGIWYHFCISPSG